jgi:DNA-binding transcriptional ArsR family regulator
MNEVFKALSDPTRRQVLQLLKRGPMTAGDLAAHFDVTKPTMSAHFSVLVHAGLIDAARQGRSITYRLRMSVLEEALLGFTQAFGLEITSRDGAGRMARAKARAGR